MVVIAKTASRSQAALLLAFRLAGALGVIVGVYIAAQFAGAPHAGWIAAGLGGPAALAVALMLRAPPEPLATRGAVLQASAPPKLTVLLASGAVLFLLVLLPVLVARLPPDDDYPNHLARLHVIALDGRDALLDQFYAIEWRVIPNLGMELVLPLLAAATGVFLAGKLFFATTMLLLLTGPHAIHWALYRRLSLGPLVAVLFAYNGVTKMGVLNYEFGIGLAMFAVAGWIALRGANPWVRAAVSAACLLALFFCHLMALAIYALVIGSFELWRLWSARREPRRLAIDAAVLALPFALAIPLFLLRPATQEGYTAPLDWGGLHARIDGLRLLLEAYFPLADLIALLAMGAALVVLLRRRVLFLHPFCWTMLAVIGAVYLVVPNRVDGSWGVVNRLPIAVLLVMIGALHWDLGSRRARAVFLAALGLLALFRTAAVEAAFWRYDRITADFEISLRLIRPGSRVLVAEVDAPPEDALTGAIEQLPLLAVIERSSLVSLMYSHPLQQILVVRPPYRASTGGFSDQPIPLPVLLAPPQLFPPGTKPMYAPSGRIYWSDWVHDYDYLYVIDRREPASPAPDRLVPLYDGDRFQLFGVKAP